MKLTDSKHEVTGTGVLEKQAFKFNASYKAFELLGDQLYSDKIGSIIRELASNAYDAHVMVGKEDVPFEIKLPSLLDNKFHVRDFGPGLSPDNMKHIYTTYFESTKNNTNDEMGGFGLGSKTPFAYTNSFTIVSRFEGMKRVYVAAMEDTGPTLSLLAEVETDELSGLEVGFTIPKIEEESKNRYGGDRVNNEFKDKMIKQLAHFKVKPNVISDSEIEWLEFKSAFADDNWFMVSQSRYNTGSINVIISNVCYQVATSNIDYDIVQKLAKIKYNYYIRIPIGILNIAISRESLSYDESTVKILDEYLQAFYKSAQIHLRTVFDRKCNTDNQTYWDACTSLSKLKYDNDLVAMSAFLGEGLYVLHKGQKHTETQVNLWTPEMFKILDKCNTINTKAYDKVYKELGIKIRTNKSYGDFKAYTASLRYTSAGIDGGLIEVSNKIRGLSGEFTSYPTILLYHDKKSINTTIIDKWMKENNHRRVILVAAKTDKIMEEYAKAIKYEGKILRVSEECVTQIASYVETKDYGYSVTRNEQYTMVDQCTMSVAGVWINGTVDFQAGGIYIPVKNYIPMTNKSMKDIELGADGIRALVTSTRRLMTIDKEHDNSTVIGVKFRALKDYIDAPQWINLFDYTDSMIKKYKRSKLPIISKMMEIAAFVKKNNYTTKKLLEVMSRTVTVKGTERSYDKIEDPVLKEICKLYHNTSKGETIIIAAALTSILTVMKFKPKKVYLDLDKIKDDYPLITCIDFSYPNLKQQARILDYINLQYRSK